MKQYNWSVEVNGVQILVEATTKEAAEASAKICYARYAKLSGVVYFETPNTIATKLTPPTT